MKVATACTQCRTSKRKCWQPEVGKPCTQCGRSQIDCSSAPRSSADSSVSPSKFEHPRLHGAQSRFRLSDDVIEELVENYIRYIHDRPHSIFHLPTLRSAVHESRLRPSLLYALLSFGARFHPKAEVSTLAPQFFEDSKRHLHLDLENISLENIQTSILLANLSAASLKASSEALYLGIAIRMAEILHFNVADYTEPYVAQELKRRIWWTLFMFDHWCSAGNSITQKMNDSDGTVDLPIDEAVFQKLDARQMIQPGRTEPGVWAHMITLVQIFGAIQDLNRRLAHENLDEEFVEHAVLALSGSLETWEADLPAYIKYNKANLYNYRAKGLGGPFVSLHMGFYHYATLLLYQYLDINRATTSRTEKFAERCKQFASSQSSLLKTARELGNCELLYPGVGHCTVISSSVLLHTLLFEEESETSVAQACLTSNFEVLKELRQYWPSLELTVRRLTVFQSACLQHAASHVYKFDRWMMKFLLEYHLPLDDKIYVETKSVVGVSDGGPNGQGSSYCMRGVFGTKVLHAFLE